MKEKIIDAINDHKAILSNLDSKDFLAIENIAK